MTLELREKSRVQERPEELPQAVIDHLLSPTDEESGAGNPSTDGPQKNYWVYRIPYAGVRYYMFEDAQ